MADLILVLNTGCLFFIVFINVLRKDKSNKLANIWFSIFLISLVIASFSSNMLSHNLDQSFPHLFKLTDLTAFALAPSLYLATNYFTIPKSRMDKYVWLHFLPVLSFFFINGKYFFIPSNELSQILRTSPNSTLYRWLEFALLSQCLVYLFLIFIRLYHFKVRRKYYEASNSKPLQWLLNSVIGISLLFVLWLLDLTGQAPYFITMAYSCCILYVGYWVVNQREVFPYVVENKVALTQFLNSAYEPENITIDNDKVTDNQKASILNLMDEKKPHLDNELNIFKLSELYGCSVHQMSAIINQVFAENFNQFINRYRVEESKKMLCDKEYSNLTILAIAYNSGFNSKTVFNITFKNLTGKTPSEYKKSCSEL